MEAETEAEALSILTAAVKLLYLQQKSNPTEISDGRDSNKKRREEETVGLINSKNRQMNGNGSGGGGGRRRGQSMIDAYSGSKRCPLLCTVYNSRTGKKRGKERRLMSH